MRRAALLCSALAVGLPVPGLGQVSIALRAGYGIPLGNAAVVVGTAFEEKDLFGGVVPLQLEGAWRITPALSAGLYWSYGLASQGSQLRDLVCHQPGASCTSVYDMRFGAQATWSFGRLGPVEPWVGLGFGMEIAHFRGRDVTFPNTTGTGPPFLTGDLVGSLRGWDMAYQAGADWPVAPSLAIGPFAQFQVGQYRVQDVTYDPLGSVASGGIPSAKPHEFLVFGLRGKFDI
jgi:hypothetical protein